MFIFKDTQKRANPYAPYTSPDGTKHIRIPSELIEEIPDPVPPVDYSDEIYFRTEQDEAPYVIYTKKPQEMIDAVNLAKAKQQRHQVVSEIIVTTQAGNSFDGNEDAQNRLARAIAGMSDIDTLPWVLADNSIKTVTKDELLEALRLSGQAQAALWVAPYLS